MAAGNMEVLKCKIPNPIHRGIDNWKMYTTKQIKISAKYRDMVPKVKACLSGTWAEADL